MHCQHCGVNLWPNWMLNRCPSLFPVLQAAAELRKSGYEMNFSFLNYAQSSECRLPTDSSVSYAAGALVVHWGWPPLGPPQRRHPALTMYRHNPTQTHPPSPLVQSTILQEGPRHSKPIQFTLSVSFLRTLVICFSPPRFEEPSLKHGFEITENQVGRMNASSISPGCSFERMIIFCFLLFCSEINTKHICKTAVFPLAHLASS